MQNDTWMEIIMGNMQSGDSLIMMSPAPSSNLYTRQLMRQSSQCQEQPSVRDESLSNTLGHPGLSPHGELSASGQNQNASSWEQLNKENGQPGNQLVNFPHETIVNGRQDPLVQHSQNLVRLDNPELVQHSQNLVRLDNPELCPDLKEEFSLQKYSYEDPPDGLVERGSGGGSFIYRPREKDSNDMRPNIASSNVKESTNFTQKSVFPKSVSGSVSKIQINDNERVYKVENNGMNTAGIKSHQSTVINNRRNIDKVGIGNVENNGMNHRYTVINNNLNTDTVGIGRPYVENNGMSIASSKSHQYITSNKLNTDKEGNGNVENNGMKTADIKSHQDTASNRLNTNQEGNGNVENNGMKTADIKSHQDRRNTDKDGIGNAQNNGMNTAGFSSREYRVASGKPNRPKPATGFMNDLRVLENVNKWNASAASKSINIREVKENVSCALGEGGANSKSKDFSAHNSNPNFCLQEDTYRGYSRAEISKIDRLPVNQSSIQSCGFSFQAESDNYIVKDEESERSDFFSKNELTAVAENLTSVISLKATQENSSVIGECQRSDDKKKSPTVPVETDKAPVKIHGQRNSISHKHQSTFFNTEIDIEKFKDFFNISKNDKPWGQKAINAMPRTSTSQHALQEKSKCLDGDVHDDHTSLAKDRTLQSMAKTVDNANESQMTNKWHAYSEGSSGISSHMNYKPLLHPPEKPFGSMDPSLMSGCLSTQFLMSPHSQLFPDDTGQFDPHFGSQNTFLSSDSSLERESLPSSTSLTSENILQTCETAMSSTTVTSRVETGTSGVCYKINSFTESPHPQVSTPNTNQAFNRPRHLETCKNTLTSLGASNKTQLSTETDRIKNLKITTSIGTSETNVSPKPVPTTTAVPITSGSADTDRCKNDQSLAGCKLTYIDKENNYNSLRLDSDSLQTATRYTVTSNQPPSLVSTNVTTSTPKCMRTAKPSCDMHHSISGTIVNVNDRNDNIVNGSELHGNTFSGTEHHEHNQKSYGERSRNDNNNDDDNVSSNNSRVEDADTFNQVSRPRRAVPGRRCLEDEEENNFQHCDNTAAVAPRDNRNHLWVRVDEPGGAVFSPFMQPDPNRLSVHDRPGCPQSYTAYLLVHPKDKTYFGLPFLMKLESWGLRIFFQDRDLILTGFLHENLARIIEERCNGKVIVVVSKNYPQSAECQALTAFARNLDPDARRRNIVPVYIDKNIENLPAILNGLASIRYNQVYRNGWLQEKILGALRA